MTKKGEQACVVKGWQDAPIIDKSTLEDDLSRHFYYTLGRDKVGKSQLYLYHALALTIRDRLVARCRDTKQQIHEQKTPQNCLLIAGVFDGACTG